MIGKSYRLRRRGSIKTAPRMTTTRMRFYFVTEVKQSSRRKERGKRRKGKKGTVEKNGGERRKDCFVFVKIAYHPDLNSIRNPGGVHGADLSHSCTMDTHAHRCMVERKVVERIRPRVKLNLNSSCHGITERSFLFDFSRLFELFPFFFSFFFSNQSCNAIQWFR